MNLRRHSTILDGADVWADMGANHQGRESESRQTTGTESQEGKRWGFVGRFRRSVSTQGVKDT